MKTTNSQPPREALATLMRGTDGFQFSLCYLSEQGHFVCNMRDLNMEKSSPAVLSFPLYAPEELSIIQQCAGVVLNARNGF